MKNNPKSSRAIIIFLAIVSCVLSFQCTPKLSQNSKSSNVSFWLTDPKENVLFQEQNKLSSSEAQNNEIITINPETKYQTMDGFGYCLTGGSARLLAQMEKNARAKLIKELFSTEGNGIGTSYLRLSIGASDLSDSVFTYNDLPFGEIDVEMKKFSIAEEQVYLIPILKEILALQPDIKIMGSPWSPPVWMKTNQNSKGGSLKPEFYDAYALYFVRYIEAMAKEGITIDAITVQNEPLHPGNNPSLLMYAQDQANFIKQSLGPAFKKANIKTKIIVYDHNADRPDYPATIYQDKEAAKYVDGAAFHLYGGKIDTLNSLHEAYPDKNLYFTEQWVGAPGKLSVNLEWHVSQLIIGATRNWCKTVLEWNLAATADYKPYTPGGCTKCVGAVTIIGNEVERNPAYYIIAHAAKFVRPGAVRIASNELDEILNVAFLNMDGSIVLVAVNNNKTAQSFQIKLGATNYTASLNSGAVGTFILN
ncbi:glycoside hydrolase family 30 protein [Pedobacter alpinus]|uniref:Glycoside hydrolase family 30 beta sandwich domain-containing protein n=1 Tax=Pedobacter alpinus TaxID=1590643 RepID=A0ABW5TTU3_9SPHI